MEIKEISPKQKGLNTELHCISYFSDCGFLVSTPYGDNGRYDLIVDVNGHLLRVQVKTASLAYDSQNEVAGIKFSCKSARINTKETYTKRYTKDEIDYFATYWNYQVYVIPVEECSSEKVLHFFEVRNNQNYLVSFLDDYTIQAQWSKFLNENKKEPIQEPEKENYKIDFSIYEKKVIKKDYFCTRCGKPITSGSTYCPKCWSFLQRRVERPSREKLKQLIRTTPFTQIGKMYGVSDKAIVKWCKAENLPEKKSIINNIPDIDWEKI